MNTELQKTICEQLPYGALKCEYTLSDVINLSNGQKDEKRIKEVSYQNLDFVVSYGKPILRRMDLTKPITHKGYNDGKEFVPIVEMAKIADCHWVHDPGLNRIDESFEDGCKVLTVYWYRENPFEFSFAYENEVAEEIALKNDPFTMVIKGQDGSGNYPVMNPARVIDFLNMLHFNWRGIPDDLVKYTDEFETDPYA